MLSPRAVPAPPVRPFGRPARTIVSATSGTALALVLALVLGAGPTAAAPPVSTARSAVGRSAVARPAASSARVSTGQTLSRTRVVPRDSPTYLPSLGPVIAAASVPDGNGYYTTSPEGGVAVSTYPAPSVSPYGSVPVPLSHPIVGMAMTPDGAGYWLVASDGGVFTFGDAHYYGSMGGRHLNKPIVTMAATPDGHGYWLVASDGGVFSFGDAHFYGSTGSIHLNKPIDAMAPTSDGHGYWFAASDGGIFTFGNAHFRGSAASHPLPYPIVSMAATPDNDGYWLLGAGGTVYSFGDAPFRGDVSSYPGYNFVSILPQPGGQGYLLCSVEAPSCTPFSAGASPAGASASLSFDPTVSGFVHITVYDPSAPGEVGADAQVTLSPKPGCSFASTTGTTDANGWWDPTFSCSYSTYIASPPGPLAAAPGVPAGDSTAPLDPLITSYAGTASAHVALHGSPVAGAEVIVLNPTAQAGNPFTGRSRCEVSPVSGIAQTNAGGNAFVSVACQTDTVIENPPNGPYTSGLPPGLGAEIPGWGWTVDLGKLIAAFLNID